MGFVSFTEPNRAKSNLMEDKATFTKQWNKPICSTSTELDSQLSLSLADLLQIVPASKSVTQGRYLITFYGLNDATLLLPLHTPKRQIWSNASFQSNCPVSYTVEAPLRTHQSGGGQI